MGRRREAGYNAGERAPALVTAGWMRLRHPAPLQRSRGYAAYHAEMDVPRHASQGRRHSLPRQARRRRASDPRDRAGDAWRDGRDRGVAEHGRHDLEDYDDDVLPDGFIPQDDTQANVDVALGSLLAPDVGPLGAAALSVTGTVDSYGGAMPDSGHEGYEASTLGRIRSPMKILKQQLHGSRGDNLYGTFLKQEQSGSQIGSSGISTIHRRGSVSSPERKSLRQSTRESGVGTPSENMLDKVRHGTHHNAIKTHCPRQHQLIEPNLVLSHLRWGSGDVSPGDRTTGT